MSAARSRRWAERRGELLARLRRHGWIYWPLRFLKRALLEFLLRLGRSLGPASADSRFGPPKGLFSECQLVREGVVPGRVILDRQPTKPLVPGSLREACGFHQNDQQPWPIFWSHRREARLVSSSLALLDEQKRLCLEAAFMEQGLPHEPGYRYFRLPPATRLAGSWTSLISRWSPGFHHWFMDALPRLALLDQFPATTRILVPDPLQPYEVETLKMMGLFGRVRPTAERHLIVEDYFFSSPTAMTGCWNPFAVEFLRRSLLDQGDPDWDSPRRFYIRRVGRSRGIANEAEVLRFFEQRGWAILDLERMSMARQIRLFSRADQIAGLHGAAFTNLLWCRPGCVVRELCARTFLNGVYEGMADCLQLNYRHLICDSDPALFMARVDLEQLRRFIEE